MNYWPECLDIWYRTSYGQGDLRQLDILNFFIRPNKKILVFPVACQIKIG